MEKIEKGSQEPKQVIGIVTLTKAIKAKLEGEDEEVRKKAEKLFKDLYYTEKLGSAKEAIWELEELSGDSHSTIMKDFPLEKFSSDEEAQHWAVERGGVSLGKKTITVWRIKYDPIQDKKLEEKKDS